jgi:hypothetical protein
VVAEVNLVILLVLERLDKVLMAVLNQALLLVLVVVVHLK